MKIKLYDFQEKGLERTANFRKVLYAWQMGLGKTIVGAEKLRRLYDDYFDTNVNLVICQKSKVDDWIDHLCEYYADDYEGIFNLTKPKQLANFMTYVDANQIPAVGVINYDLLFRRKELVDMLRLTDHLSIMLDESSMIKNETAKRSKCILSLGAENVILLSGTPVGGKYEELWSQCRLLGWKISKREFWDRYVIWRDWFPAGQAFPIKMVTGYKNVDDLKFNLKMHGADFLKSEDVITLPEQVFNTVYVPMNKEYKQLLKHGIAMGRAEKDEFVRLKADTPLNRLLALRQLCGMYSIEKRGAFMDWVNSNNERLIVFYNFTEELNHLTKLITDRPISIVNGKTKDLKAYEECSNSITFIQYQAGAMGLNLQKAHYVAYYTLPLSSELFEQSKKRINRIGQDKTCFYYYFIVKGSVEEQILSTLEKRNDYTMALFEGGKQ